MDKYKIGIIGGTGREGKGLGYRWALAGHTILIGSRSEEKAQAAVAELKELLHGEGEVFGMVNEQAVRACDIAVLTVPFAAHKSTLEGLKDALQGKLLIDVVVPLVPPKVTRVTMPEEGSASQQARAVLGPDSKVVAAFQTISFERLLSGELVDSEVFVCGTDKESRELVIGLAEEIGLKAWDAGVIQNAVVVEGLTSILIGLNIKYNVQSAGIRITGIA